MNYRSHPTRVRGLKPITFVLSQEHPESHHTRVRGVKQITLNTNTILMLSHPTRVRGLKHYETVSFAYAE